MKPNIHTSIYKPILLILFLFVISYIALNSYLHYQKFLESKNEIQNTILQNQKNNLKNKVDFIVSEVDSTIQKETKSVKENLKSRVDTAFNIANNIYKTHQDKPNVLELVKESLRELQYHDIGNQYIFLTKLDGTLILLPGLEGIEGKNLYDLQTKSNIEAFEEIIKMLKKQNEGYHEYQWQNHITLEFETKVSYFRYFEPFDCYIGTGVFQSDIDEKLKKTFIEKLESYKIGDQMKNYFFAASYSGFSLTGPGKGTNVYNITDINGKKLVQELIKTAQKGSGFVTYVMPTGQDKSHEKLSYVKGIDKWKMYVGTGEILTDVQAHINLKKQELIDSLYNSLLITTIFSIIFFIFFYYLFNRLKSSLTFDINNLINSIESLITKNQKVDTQKIRFKEFDTIGNHANDLLKKKIEMESELKDKEAILFHQSKMAAMGEMMENIAHQWRQPLSMITTSSSSIIVKHELNMLDDKYLENSLENVIYNCEYLSNTIDDFRNFFRKDKQKVELNIEETIEKSLKLLESKLKTSDIKLIKNIENKSLIGYQNELIQVLLVILNNAKDALEETESKKYIFIKTTSDENYIYINILDNANGIKETIVDKIFDPYFTTKHQSKGTGVGLYMANQIISNHMEGTLKVNNKSYEYNQEKYTGAQFIIRLPLNSP